MTNKQLTVVLYGCDRNLWRGGPLKIRISDIFASGGPKLLYRGETDAATLDLQLELPFDAGQLYGFTFSAPGHRPAWRLVRRIDFISPSDSVELDSLLLRLMLVPDSPGTSDLPNGFGQLVRRASPFAAPGGLDEAMFQSLPTAAQMACLNIEAKLRATLVDGTSVLSFVRGVRHVAVDRAFLFFESGLKDRVARVADFAGAAGHDAPESVPDLPAHPDSWKHTRFAEGNVQLSFSRDTMPLPGGNGILVHSADVDIDLGRGLAHVVEWLENNVFRPGHKTNQALVYALLYDQNILPAYVLDAVPATTTTRSLEVRLSRVPDRTTARRRRSARKRTPAVTRKKASAGRRRPRARRR
jgi:hypothetical protein